MSGRTGVAASALRHDEAEGLIGSERADGGQRRLARDAIRRVSFIRVAQQVGLSLVDIRAPQSRRRGRTVGYRTRTARRPPTGVGARLERPTQS